uniref:hypothetical protein n=1 Tax=Niallia taxi TaxID=2499688 RepID=UPI003F491C23
MNVIGRKRIETSAYRWKKAFDKDGTLGLLDSRETASGRPIKRALSQAEVIERQEARIKLLEGQVELLKKLEGTERRLLNEVSKNCSLYFSGYKCLSLLFPLVLLFSNFSNKESVNSPKLLGACVKVILEFQE